MVIVKIDPLPGSDLHLFQMQENRNEVWEAGYAEVPAEVDMPDTVPYVHLVVVDGVVTEMTPGEVPNKEEEMTDYE